MLNEGFDPELMKVHAQALVTDLRGTMSTTRRRGRLFPVRRWAGRRLIRLGSLIAAEPALRRDAA